MLSSFFVPEGRAGRMAFWRATAVIGIIFQLASLALLLIGEGLISLPLTALEGGLLLLLAIALWASTIVGVQRLHDRGQSGWWMLLAFVPIVGTLWHLVANGCLVGTAGPNRYGAATDGAHAIVDVFADDGRPAGGRSRRAGLAGTLALWVVCLAVTAITVLLFQNPNR